MDKYKSDFDIIISGGGLSGALSALSLSGLTKKDGSLLSIAIIEANPVHQSPQSTFDSRVLALSHGSVEYLTSLSIWGDIAAKASAIKNIHISDKNYYGKARISAQDHQVSALGYVVEMSVLGQVFLSKLKHRANVTWFCPDYITNIDWQKNSVDITLNSSLKLTGKLLLACDGGQSTCRQFANISSSNKPYQQSALIANVTMMNAHQSIAYERFTESGPIAMLPLKDQVYDSHKCSLVWTLTPEQADDYIKLDEESFKQQFELSFGSWLGAIDKVGERAIYPLSLVQADEQIYHRMVLVGNASHTIHPIAGQGFNLGLRDVQQLNDVIANNLEQAIDIANFAQLTKYALKRKADHQEVINLTDSLVTLFSNDLLPLVIGRNIGLKVLNYCSTLKNAFVNKTMGY